MAGEAGSKAQLSMKCLPQVGLFQTLVPSASGAITEGVWKPADRALLEKGSPLEGYISLPPHLFLMLHSLSEMSSKPSLTMLPLHC